jgi:hypothetical protein
MTFLVFWSLARIARPRETRRPRTPACSCGMRVLISFTLLYVVSPFIVEDTAHAMIDTLWECHSRACDAFTSPVQRNSGAVYQSAVPTRSRSCLHGMMEELVNH